MALQLSAQEVQPKSQGRQAFEERLSSLINDGIIDEEQSHNLQERYEELRLNPLDLNTATLDDLYTLPLISEYEAYQCFLYRANKGGKFSDISEIKEIPSWTDELCTLLYPLLRLSSVKAQVSTPNLRQLLQDGKSRLSLLAGYTHNPTKQKQYIGSPDALGIIYRYKNRQHLSFALGAQKDTYEPWAWGAYKGFDSYHGHIALHNMGIIRSIILGQYRASWAEGLILNQGFQLRSAIYGSTSEGIRPTFGLSEQGISQGVALELNLTKNLTLSTLASWRQIDGAIDSESSSITGLYDGGLHRDERSLMRKWSIPQHHYGLRLALSLGRLRLALQGVHYDFGQNALSHASGVAIREYLNNLNKFGNVSLSYSITTARGQGKLSGEIASSANGAWATLHRGQYTLGNSQLFATAYFVAPDYWAYLGQSNTHYHYPNNELGGNVGLIMPFKGIRLSAEGNVYARKESLMASTYTISKGLRVEAQYKMSKSLDNRLRLSYRSDEQSSNYRLAYTLNYKADPFYLQLNTLLSQSGKRQLPNAEDTPRNALLYTPLSYAVGLTLRYEREQGYRLWVNTIYQQVEQWADRLYITQPRLSEEYGYTPLYGRGWLIAAGAIYHLSQHITLGLKATQQMLREPRPHQSSLIIHFIYH